MSNEVSVKCLTLGAQLVDLKESEGTQEPQRPATDMPSAPLRAPEPNTGAQLSDLFIQKLIFLKKYSFWFSGVSEIRAHPILQMRRTKSGEENILTREASGGGSPWILFLVLPLGNLPKP